MNYLPADLNHYMHKRLGWAKEAAKELRRDESDIEWEAKDILAIDVCSQAELNMLAKLSDQIGVA